MSLAQAPIRVDKELADSAREVAPTMSRSVAQQISHWARLGRELERSPELNIAAIQAVLSGQGDFDALPPKEQAVVRAQWQSRMNAILGSLRLDKAFRAESHQYAEVDDSGRVVTRPSGHPTATS